MATTARPLADEEREQRRAPQRELVTASIGQLRTGDGWQRYLKTRAPSGRPPHYLQGQRHLGRPIRLRPLMTYRRRWRGAQTEEVDVTFEMLVAEAEHDLATRVPAGRTARCRVTPEGAVWPTS